ncbi:MAG: hypothetical protein H6740_21095 [Alphaproteobacteria bacterium]|nr:hypothetical protein [Alphaproteobacteria bacterium]
MSDKDQAPIAAAPPEERLLQEEQRRRRLRELLADDVNAPGVADAAFFQAMRARQRE